jgi:hypothetical protein
LGVIQIQILMIKGLLLLVSDPISSLSLVGMPNPIIPFSSTIFDPSPLSLFLTTTRL